MSFLDKYVPKTLSDLYGNKIQIQKAKEWIANFRTNKKKVLLICGPPGLGKTSLSHLILKEFNYHPVEFNASEVRSSKIIEQKLSKIINQQSIMMMFDKNKNKLGIIMDEIDGCLNGDRGGVTQLIKMIKPKKNKKFILNTPMICICNNDSSKNIQELKKISEYIKFKLPSRYDLTEFLKKISNLEDIKLKESHYKYIINHSQNDFRRILTILESIKSKFKKKLKKKILNLLLKF